MNKDKAVLSVERAMTRINNGIFDLEESLETFSFKHLI